MELNRAKSQPYRHATGDYFYGSEVGFDFVNV
jgi:hypothetical protein